MQAEAALPPAIRVFESVDPEIKKQVNAFLGDYFSLNQMLIEDSLAGARIAAASFANTVSKFEVAGFTAEQLDFYFMESPRLKQGIEAVKESTDIEQARVALATISESMYSLVKAFHPYESTLYYQYCPMARDGKGGNWLSTTKQLVNPYMGQMMLECGRTQEVLD